MADEAARRREIRRRKILENAEERKKKIFGLSKSSANEGIKINFVLVIQKYSCHLC